MRQFKVTFFFLAVALTLSGCGIFGGSDGSEISTAQQPEEQPTTNSVGSAPAESEVAAEPAAESDGGAADGGTTDGGTADDGTTTDGATAALPTAVTLATAEPLPEPTADRSQPSTYVVQSGDVLGLLAEQFDVDIAELRRVNNLDGNLIRVGQELTIPALDGSTTATDDTTESATDSAAAPAESASSAPAAPVSCNSTATGHCVQPGESLLGIAVQYDVTVESLRAANPGVSGDLIKSGEVLNLPGTSSAAADDPAPAAAADDPAPAAAADDPVPAGDPAPALAVDPAVTVGPANDADCAARNPEFPFFHAADGLCYANPIGATVVPTSAGAAIAADGSAEECEPGRFLWNDGLCYPIPGATVEATAGPTPTTDTTVFDYGRPPCREGYVVLVSTNRCWPEADTANPTTVTPVPDTTTGTTTDTTNTVSCAEPNFTSDAVGKCFLTQAGVDAGCTLEDNVAKCP